MGRRKSFSNRVDADYYRFKHSAVLGLVFYNANVFPNRRVTYRR